MPTTFFGLFLFSTALSLVATFSVLGLLAVGRAIRQRLTLRRADRIGSD